MLGGPSGTGAGPAGAALIDDVQQPGGGERFEVEGRGGAQQLQGGGLVAAHGFGLAYNVVVQPAPGRLVEHGVGRDAGLGVLHDHHSKTNLC